MKRNDVTCLKCSNFDCSLCYSDRFDQHVSLNLFSEIRNEKPFGGWNLTRSKIIWEIPSEWVTWLAVWLPGHLLNKHTAMSVPAARAARCEHWDSFFKQKKKKQNLFLTLGYASWSCVCCAEARPALWESPAADVCPCSAVLRHKSPGMCGVSLSLSCVPSPAGQWLSSPQAPWDNNKSRAGRSQVQRAFGAGCLKQRLCLLLITELLIYPWACAVVLSSNGENLFLKTQVCHVFYEFRCLNWC